MTPSSKFDRPLEKTDATHPISSHSPPFQLNSETNLAWTFNACQAGSPFLTLETIPWSWVPLAPSVSCIQKDTQSSECACAQTWACGIHHSYMPTGMYSCGTTDHLPPSQVSHVGPICHGLSGVAVFATGCGRVAFDVTTSRFPLGPVTTSRKHRPH